MTGRPRAVTASTKLLIVALLIFGASASACSTGGAASTATPEASKTPTPGRPSATAFPTFTPTPVLDAGAEIVVGGDLRTRSAPSTQAPMVGTLKDLQRVQILRALAGENWLVGAQRWLSTIPEWTTTWYELSDHSYVYASFIYVQQPGETSPLVDAKGQEKWVDVNVSAQTATAMVGAQAVYSAPVSTGSPQFPSPLGTHHIEKDGRLAVERMTASQAGYSASQASYDVERVLFTQYYDLKGDALHMNYWRPASVFGRQATSHGCVGLQAHDAQWLWLFGFGGMRVEIHT